ncbi:hypothetical protein SPHV1_1630004 [Novosphingobium sp. KN65.2]|nr:hypothetical protein SPHV1_1630004 [Novosphingobium sp. KN65.2]
MIAIRKRQDVGLQLDIAALPTGMTDALQRYAIAMRHGECFGDTGWQAHSPGSCCGLGLA